MSNQKSMTESMLDSNFGKQIIKSGQPVVFDVKGDYAETFKSFSEEKKEEVVETINKNVTTKIFLKEE